MTSQHLFQGNEIELANGRPFDPARPDSASIDLYSIAHSLAQQCRYGGHCRKFASIAEHSILVAEKLRRIGASPQLQIAGLHHDSHEALDGIGDVQRPAKPLLDTTYRERVGLIDDAVWQALALPGPLWTVEMLHHPLVKRIDVWALAFEAKQLMVSRGEGWQLDNGESSGLPPIHDDDADTIYGWSPIDARDEFIECHYRLAQEIRQR